MGKETAILFLGLVFYLRICFATFLNGSNIDESSLLAFKASINSEILATNWSQETSFCTWIGVSCNQRHSRVTGLNLSNMNLRGTIAREIGNLSFLTFFNISNCNINGQIPSEIGKLRCLRVLDMAFNTLSGQIPLGFGNLSQLQHLSLGFNQLTEIPSVIFNISSLLSINVGQNQMSGRIPKNICSQPATKLEELGLFMNQFDGEIPSALMRCHSLKVLSLDGNKFTGNILSEIWNLSAIQVVSLDGNGFTGIIPSSIGNLSNLMYFDITENSFYGTVPSKIGQLSNLRFLSLQANNLNGEVPQSIFNLSSIQLLSLARNNLSGSLPFSLDIGLPNIEQLYLHDNHFQGKIPNSISNLSRLVVLDLSHNSFSGVIPRNLGNLHNLQMLNLSFNQLTNDLSKPEQDFLSSLATCENLKFINISSNPITGVLPTSLGSGNLLASLGSFEASSCRIKGPLPDEIGNFSNLYILDLADNDLMGPIPATLGYLSNLRTLLINGNKLQGSIFDVLCNLNNLNSVNLSENNLFGQLPRCLGNLSSLREIYLSDNAFNSNIPPTLWSNLGVVRMNFSNNFLDGSLSQEIGNMKSLLELDLSGNQLSGEIPGTISQLQNLISLSLSNNKLDGPISESFAYLQQLQYLNLSQNNFSGPIPKSLEELRFLKYFDVSFNELSGEIPDGGPFIKFKSEFFIGNEGLCGASRLKVEACPIRSTANPSSNRLTNNTSLLGPILGSTLGVLCVAVAVGTTLFVYRRRRRRSEEVEEDYLDHVPGMPTRFSYEELATATDNFHMKLGEGGFGSVFEGSLNDGTRIAVKRLDGVGHIKRSFLAEVESIGSIHHINLVRLIGFCAEKSHRLLVYEFMCNGSLDRWIYCGSHETPLNWNYRRKIILDIAKGLAYLHEDCRQKIFHLDIKPQNILLDEQYNAKLADFGLSKLIDRNQNQVVTTMRGTPGYLAPEWLSAVITEKVDVYSFGVVILEILCGRKIFEQSKPEEERYLLTLLKKKSEEGQWLDLVDKCCQDVESNLAEVEEIMQISAWCLQNDHEKRPSMSMVIKVLEGVKDVPNDIDYNFFIPQYLVSRIPEVSSQDLTQLLPSVLSGPR